MERLQQLANHSFYGEQPDMESFDKVLGPYCLKLLFEQDEEDETRTCSETNLSLQNYSTMPFLQMLQSTELDSVQFSEEALYRLDPLKKSWEMENPIMTMDFESCITQETMAQQQHQQEQPHYSTCCLDGLSPACEQEEQAIESFGNSRGSTSPAIGTRTTSSEKDHLMSKSVPLSREKRKRKRSKRPTKNKDEVESQRMTHIAVERNRRRQMNEHLNTLRALMPPSYIQRGDQASIIGGAINFVKELEQLLESLQAQKRMRMNNTAKEETEESSEVWTNEGNCSEGLGRCGRGFPVESSKSVAATAEIDVTVIQTNVNLRIQCENRPGQLLKTIIALEDLRLTVLHLNITSSENLIQYSFNLKIEEDCKIGSADEIAGAVHQIFNFINGF